MIDETHSNSRRHRPGFPWRPVRHALHTGARQGAGPRSGRRRTDRPLPEAGLLVQRRTLRLQLHRCRRSHRAGGPTAVRRQVRRSAERHRDLPPPGGTGHAPDLGPQWHLQRGDPGRCLWSGACGLVRGGADGRQEGGQPRRLRPHWGTGSRRPRRGGHQPPPAAHRVF